MTIRSFWNSVMNVMRCELILEKRLKLSEKIIEWKNENENVLKLKFELVDKIHEVENENVRLKGQFKDFQKSLPKVTKG